MNSTSDKIDLFSDSSDITTMDLGNSFDYIHDYYINSYDYTIDSVDAIIDDTTNSKGCSVVSNDDSINIIHDNGSGKHIQKKPYESASKKYNEKKAQKEKAKAAAKAASKAQNKSRTSSSTYHAYKNHINTPNTSKTTNTSHNEVFNTNSTVNRTSGGAIKLIIFLFIILPYVASIFFSCVGDIIDSL